MASIASEGDQVNHSEPASTAPLRSRLGIGRLDNRVMSDRNIRMIGRIALGVAVLLACAKPVKGAVHRLWRFGKTSDPAAWPTGRARIRRGSVRTIQLERRGDRNCGGVTTAGHLVGRAADRQK